MRRNLVILLLVVITMAGVLLFLSRTNFYRYLRTQVAQPTQVQKQFAWTPPSDFQPGTYTLQLQATDEQGNVTTKNVTIEVLPPAAQNPGDRNGDDVVNIDDLTIVTGHFGQTSTDSSWDASADANGDGIINIDDLLDVTANFGKTY